jgi:hypothetical protein
VPEKIKINRMGYRLRPKFINVIDFKVLEWLAGDELVSCFPLSVPIGTESLLVPRPIRTIQPKAIV